MSRTDVHRPWPVQISDPTNRHLLYRYPARPDQMALTSWRNIGCGCRMCTGHDGRKQARRQERAEWRGIRQRLLAEVDRDQDVPPIRGKAW